VVVIKLVSRFLFGGELWKTNWELLVTAGYFLLSSLGLRRGMVEVQYQEREKAKNAIEKYRIKG